MANLFHVDRDNDTITLGVATTTVGLTPATASRLLSTDGSKDLVSTDLASWVAQTANQVLVADDADGTITLSTPQDIHTGATPTFAGLILSTAGKLTLRDSAIGVYSQADTFLDLFADGAIRIGDSSAGAPTNYTNFAADGELTLVGTARVTNEFAINAISLAPGATGPDAVILGNSIGYSYDINDDSVMNFKVPYDCDTSEDIKIEIYWYINEAYATNSGEVQWRAQWSACPADASEAIDAPTHTGTIDFGDQDIPATAKFLTEKSGVISAASVSDGDFISMTIDRVALDDGSDPTADPVIVQIEVEYTKNKLGKAT